MPNRIIREGWLDSDRIDVLDPEAEVFFLRLCLKADDFGRFTANPKLLKSLLFPLKENLNKAKLVNALKACAAAGLVTIYTVLGKEYLEIPRFEQRTRANYSKYPANPNSVDGPKLSNVSGNTVGPAPLNDGGNSPGEAVGKSADGAVSGGSLPVNGLQHTVGEGRSPPPADRQPHDTGPPSADTCQTHDRHPRTVVGDEVGDDHRSTIPRRSGGPDSSEGGGGAIALIFPIVGDNPQWGLLQSKVDEYRESFPGVDVMTELRTARQWCIDNPKQRKTARGMTHFLGSWLARRQNRAAGSLFGSNPSGTYKPASNQR